MTGTFGPDSSPSPSDTGFTLVEVLVALVVLGLGVVALMGGFAIAIRTSSLNRNQANVDGALVFASEQVKSAAFIPCNPNPGVGSDREPTYVNTSTNVWASPQPGFATSAYQTWPVYTSTPASVPGGTGFFVVTVQSWSGTSWYTASITNGLQCPSVDDIEDVTITAYAPLRSTTQKMDVLKGNWS